MQQSPGRSRGTNSVHSSYPSGTAKGERATTAFVVPSTHRSSVQRFTLLRFATASVRNIFATVRHLSMRPLIIPAHLACSFISLSFERRGICLSVWHGKKETIYSTRYCTRYPAFSLALWHCHCCTCVAVLMASEGLDRHLLMDCARIWMVG